MESGRGDGGDAWADFGKGYSTSESVDGVADTWDDPLAGSFGQLRRLKMMHPGLKVLISLGGWTWSKHFSAAGATDALRKRLVKSCIDLYIRGNLPVIDGRGGPGTGAGVFDGIDIDWEYPGILGLDYNSVSPEDGARFELLLQEFRAQLDAAGAELGGRYFGLTSAVGAGDDKIKGTDPSKYTKQLDWLLLMSYDYFGGWDASGPTDCHSILFSDPASPHVTNTSTGLPSKFAQYNTDSALRNIMAAGAPPSKIVMGLPFYGRGWTGVAKGTGTYPGLYQAATGPAPGKIEAGIEDYKVLKALTAPVSVHPVTKQSFVYDESARTFWSYDTPAVIGTKVVYAKEKKLKGVFACGFHGLLPALRINCAHDRLPGSLDGDTEDGELVSAMAAFASG
ncbi:chitinase [Hyaloraphidium curvatum]|nr:chitinase [Hyaloraphidium curvatum]